MTTSTLKIMLWDKEVGRLTYAIRLPVSARPTALDLGPQPPLHDVATRTALLAPHLIDYCRQGGQMD